MFIFFCDILSARPIAAPLRESSLPLNQSLLRDTIIDGMNKLLKTLTIVIFGSLIILCSFAKNFEMSPGGIGVLPEPRIKFPTSEKVALTGKEYLEFKWLSYYAGVDRYEFRLYKGYNMYLKDLLIKQTLPRHIASFKVHADEFENNQVYTWSLLQVSFTGEKSDKSFCSFTVIK